ncbi:MAG: nucleotide exchange factor GrpE [Myxococcota bacterium]
MPVRSQPVADVPDEPTPVGAPPPPAAEPPPASEPPPEAERDTEVRLREAVTELNATKERLKREAERERAQLRSQLVSELLPVLDNLDRSLEASRNSPDQGLRQGVQMVRDQFDQVLEKYGVELIEAEGVKFDPAEHEAISMARVDDPERDRTVIAVHRPGYRQDGKLLRAALVTVGDYRPDESVHVM